MAPTVPKRRLDALLVEARPGDLILVAGRPGVGKTTFALDLSLRAAVARHLPTTYFSLAAAADRLTNSLLCRAAGLDERRLRRGRIRDGEFRRLLAASEPIVTAPLAIDDRPGLSVAEIRAALKAPPNRDYLPQLVIVDYMQLLRRGRVRESVENETRRLSGALKRLAVQAHVILVALGALSRAGGMRRVPRAGDLGEWQCLAAAADTVVLLHRTNYFDPHASDRLRILVSKRRAS